jgi:hypothetical protein
MSKYTNRYNQRYNTKFLTFAAIGLITTALAATVGQSNDGRLNPELKARAHRVFAYDQKHEGQLAPNRLYALSIAIKFQDNQGVAQLVGQLENEMHSR